MSLSDPRYLLFLLVATVVFYALRPGTPRVVLLLAASYLFYFRLSGYYGLVLVVVTAATFAGGRLLAAPSFKARRGALFASVCVIVLAPLLVFKYLGFIASALHLSLHPPAFTAFLPIGISFFTFAALGYLIDVYLEVGEPERDPLRLALFLAFFPLVTAGPIERGARLLPQFELDARFTSERGLAALRLIFVGLILKVLFADTLIGPVNAVYAAPADYVPLEKLFALVHYMFYIYADFAGYSLIAIGSAKLLGLEVTPNFRQPFLSNSVPEFWRNWHISLSSWVRDYLFTPMRMHWRRYPTAGMVAALMLSFLILGVWHGAGWGFVLFGLFHGLLVVGSTYTLKRRDALWSAVGMPAPMVQGGRVVLTFILVMLTFVVYKAGSLHDARLIYRDVLSADLFRNIWYTVQIRLHHPGEPLALKAIMLRSPGWLIILVIIAGDVLARRNVTLEKMPVVVQLVLYNVGVALLLYAWTARNAAQPFLYYQF
jgi:alginate O-acetyltransferase complex protein AlgI